MTIKDKFAKKLIKIEKICPEWQLPNRVTELFKYFKLYYLLYTRIT